jgi:hypothetical protein
MNNQAHRAIRHSSAVFLILAAFQGVAGLFFYPGSVFQEPLLNALIFSILAIALLFLKSRIVALLLLLFSMVTIIPIFTNSNSLLAGGNILIAILLIRASIKAVEATFKLHGKLSNSPDEL